MHVRVGIHTLVKNIAQIGNILQLRLGNLFRVLSISELVDNSLTKLVPRIRVTGQVEESRTEQAGSGVTASKKDVEHFVPEGLRIISFSGKRITEDVAVFFLFWVPLGLKCESHVVIDHLVDLLVGVAEFLGADQPVEHLRSGPRGEPGLRGIESFRESFCVSNRRPLKQTIRAGRHAADRLSE